MAGQVLDFNSALVEFMQGVQAEDLAKEAVGLPPGNLSGFFSRGGILGALNRPDEGQTPGILNKLQQAIGGGPQEDPRRFGTPPPDLIPGQIIEQDVGEFPTAEEQFPGQARLPGEITSARKALPEAKKQQLSRLIEIQRIDPKMAALTMKIIQTGKAEDLLAATKEAEVALQESNAILNQSDETLNSAIADIVRTRSQRGLSSPKLIRAAQATDMDTKRELLKLRRDLATKTSDMFKLRQDEVKAQDAQKLERLKGQITAEENRIKAQETTDLEILKSQLKVEEEALKPVTPPETFLPVFDKDGNIIGQKSSKTGKVVTDPRTIEPIKKLDIERKLDLAGITDPKVRKDIIVKSLTKPVKPRDLAKELGIKIEPGFRLLDPNDPTKGVTPIEGGGKDRLTVEQASKVQMLRTAKSQFGDLRKLIFDKDGSLNRFNLFTANTGIGIPFTDIGTPGIPFTDGDLLRAKFEFGIQAITRGETGAAMPPAEVENTRIRFMPKPTDTKEIVEIKVQMYEDFINGAIKLIDPTGRFETDRFGVENEIGEFNEEKFDNEFERRVQGGDRPKTPARTPAKAPATQPKGIPAPPPGFVVQ